MCTSLPGCLAGIFGLDGFDRILKENQAPWVCLHCDPAPLVRVQQEEGWDLESLSKCVLIQFLKSSPTSTRQGEPLHGLVTQVYA